MATSKLCPSRIAFSLLVLWLFCNWPVNLGIYADGRRGVSFC